jgi:tetratricopeptide (TPR) repeat protein
MRDLKTFQEKVEAYRKNAPTPRTQKELAAAITLDKDELSKRLNAYKHPNRTISPITCAQVQAIVRVLARWGAIETQEQAKDLLDLMECSHPGDADWQTYPLKNLKAISSLTYSLGPQRSDDDRRKGEKLIWLRAMLSDHSGFLHDRVESFVGRKPELAEIRQRIRAMLVTGGYITITGQAGQGKSSVIAKLVHEYGPEKTAYHFIPFNPGPDYQVSLLRDVMARLILKHNLSDLYVASESRSALRAYFPRILAEVVAKGEREVIFIDGLDQLEEEDTTVRDLSFLPSDPPPGIVFVLGTRPNETLKPLELLKPFQEYQLPGLSRLDFDLILQHRGVQISREVANRFYQAMDKNALYLDLVAKELTEQETVSPQGLISQLSDNPQSIFSLAINRFKRRPLEWYEVIKPTLGVLLASREPLGLHHIRQIIDDERVDDERLRDGIDRLGGLVIRNWQRRYTLFHPMFYEYLRQDDQKPTKEYIFAKRDEEGWHKKFMLWCEQGHLPVIWQDVRHDSTQQQRREYARHHYITHLYLAKEWQRLFEVLDTEEYGHAKLRFDPSTRSYAQDIQLGQLAASWEGWSLKEGITLLPRLWQYTLLQGNLASRADNYPEEGFRLLALLKREREALGLAEQLTNLSRKAHMLCIIAESLRIQGHSEAIWLELHMRAHEVILTIEKNDARAWALRILGGALAKAQEWEQAEVIWTEAEQVINTIEESHARAEALRTLGEALAEARQLEWAKAIWTEAEQAINTIERSDERVWPLLALGETLAKAKQLELAKAVWAKVREMIKITKVSEVRPGALSTLGQALAKAQQWEQAETVISTIEKSAPRAQALYVLGIALAKDQQWKRAEAVWRSADKIIGAIKESEERAEALHFVGVVLEGTQQWERIEGMINTIETSDLRARPLHSLGFSLAKAHQWERAETVISTIGDSDLRAGALCLLGEALAKAQQWERAKTVINTIQRSDLQARALTTLAEALAEAQQLGQAEAVWAEAEPLIKVGERNPLRAWALRRMANTLIEVQQWEWAETVINMIENGDERAWALNWLGEALAKAQQPERAETIWVQSEHAIKMIEKSDLRILTLRSLGNEFAKAQRWARAEAVISTIENSDERAWGLRTLGEELAKAQQWERAEAVISTIERSALRASALRALGEALAEAQQWKRAKTILMEAEQVLETTEEQDLQIRALCGLRIALVKAQQWEWAEAVWAKTKRVINLVQKSDERAKWLCTLGEAMDRSGQSMQADTAWTEADQVISTIKRGDERDWIWRILGEKLVASHRWEWAEAVISVIERDDLRAMVLQSMGTELAKMQQWERAEAVISAIERSDIRAGALHALGEALSKVQQWERAEAVISTIGRNDLRVDALRALGETLAMSRQWERAEVLISTIEDNDAKIRALRVFGDELAKNQQWEFLLHLIHRFWRIVRSTDEALEIFSMCTGFILQCNELGAAFEKAYIWANTFLKGDAKASL